MTIPQVMVRSATAAALLIVALAVAALPGRVPAQLSPSLTRAPYVQNPTTSSVEILWKTDTGGDSVLRFGSTTAYGSEATGTPGRSSIGAGTVGFIHRVQVNGLEPDTRYYYQVLTAGTALTLADTDHYFETPPQTGSTAPFRFTAMGDIGNGSYHAQRVASLVDSLNPDFYLGLGDIVYDYYQEDTQDPRLFQLYRSVFRNTAWYPTCGNHDNAGCPILVDNHSLPASSPFITNPDPYLRRTVYSFDYGNAHFLALDSNIDISSVSAQLQWAQADLAASNATWKVMYWHHNAWSSGSHSSLLGDARGMDAAQFAIENGVDVVLWGHSHTYERFDLFQGVQFFTSGNGGHAGSTLCLDHALDTPPGPRCLAGEMEDEAGVLAATVSGDSIKFCQWNELGVAQDGFVLSKAGTAVNEPCQSLNAPPTPETTSVPTVTPSPSGGVPSQGTLLTLTPIADATVKERNPTSNYGNSTQLQVDAAPADIAYLKFDRSPAAGNAIASARLRLKVTNGSSSSQAVRAVLDTAWTEAGITYGNRPPLATAPITVINGGALGQWLEVDVSQGLIDHSGSLFSVAVDTTGTDGLDFSSRETPDSPQLIILLASGDEPTTPAPTPTPTPTATPPQEPTVLHS